MSVVFASEKTPDQNISVMSLNIYGWKTMPQKATDYAKLIQSENIDVLAIQEGAEDWEITTQFPTDYSRAVALHAALEEEEKECWQQHYQLFINQCAGIKFIKAERFDLTNGPKATRTGEYALLEKAGHQFLFVNIHWDHQSPDTQKKNAQETAALIRQLPAHPLILVGDFNSPCSGSIVSIASNQAKLNLMGDGGIDCIFTRTFEGSAKEIDASPSDHPAVVALLKVPLVKAPMVTE
ncbi:endonuclease/exonuclease/phosphatase family protein [Paraglaciecola sp.]|uniref:endonuclease/exonuclease/phosphatase family protein n=1 Tax=Paraglaciecola sp. TaxID=1920173 RepID=UPI003EF516C9